MPATTAEEIVPGATLKNGAVVVVTGERRNYLIVLAVRTVFGGESYVTWAVSPRDGECFWGHYFDDFQEAVGDFESRVSGRLD